MQQQKGGRDCGLFAIAIATALCFGIPPSHTEWDQGRMHKHLLRCFEGGKMEPFPGKNVQARGEVAETLQVKIYCSCRLPEEKRRMARCSGCGEWFHKSCEANADVVFRRKATFVCKRCL